MGEWSSIEVSEMTVDEAVAAAEALGGDAEVDAVFSDLMQEIYSWYEINVERMREIVHPPAVSSVGAR
jgi:hypothetical protein